jgi:hypothetical protein
VQRLRSLFSLCCLGWIAPVFGAAEGPVVAPSSETPEESAIAGAKKSFDTLGRKRTTEERGLDLPKLTAPELNLAGPSDVRSPKPKTPAKSSKSWLVDGVMGPVADPLKPGLAADPSRPELESTAELGQARFVERGEGLSDLRSLQKDPPKTPRDLGPEIAPVAAPNPLAGFMSYWISSQDRSLLLPAGPTLPGTADRSGGIVDDLQARSLANGATLSPNGSTVSAATFLPATNPYLSISGIGESAAGLGAVARAKIESFEAMPKTMESIGRIGPAPQLAVPAETPATRNLAKPSDDEKYFKQLKRF